MIRRSPGWEEVRDTYLLCIALANAALRSAIGTNLQDADCPSSSVNAACQAAFLGIHLTPKSSAYFEVRRMVSSAQKSPLNEKLGNVGVDCRP